MELTKISMPTPNDDDDHNSSSSSSTRRKKREFIAVLVLCFTLILAAIISVLAVLKYHIETAKNPALAIQSVCSLSGYPDPYCYIILSPLRTSSEINPTQIFTLAVRSAIDAITELTPLPDSTDPETNSTLRSCEVAFNETLSQLTAGAGVGNLTTESLTCLNRLNYHWLTESFLSAKKYSWKSTRYASSSLRMLRRANMISETLNPTIKSTLASFLAGWNNALSVFVFGAQYLYLVVLFCIVLRLW